MQCSAVQYSTYLLLTEFEVRTVSYGPSFFPLIYGPSAKRAGHKLTGKNEDPQARKLVKVKRKVQLPQRLPSQNSKN